MYKSNCSVFYSSLIHFHIFLYVHERCVCVAREVDSFFFEDVIEDAYDWRWFFFKKKKKNSADPWRLTYLTRNWVFSLSLALWKILLHFYYLHRNLNIFFLFLFNIEFKKREKISRHCTMSRKWWMKERKVKAEFLP